MRLCVSIVEKGWKFITLIEKEKLDVAYFPVVAEWARGEPGKRLGWLGSAVKWFGGLGSNFTFLDLAMDISRSRSLLYCWDVLRG